MNIDGNTTVTVSIIISLVTMTTLFGRWQGRVDNKLDTILDGNNKLKEQFHKLVEDVNKLHTRVSVHDSEIESLKAPKTRSRKTNTND